MQLLINIFIYANLIILMGLGFGLIFSVTKFFHFTHAIIFTTGAYLLFAFTFTFKLPIEISIVVSVMLCGMIGYLLERLLYFPLRKREASTIILLLASLGVYVVGQNLISLVFGDEIKLIYTRMTEIRLNIGSGRITLLQLSSIVLGFLICWGVWFLSKKTLMGSKMRAVADAPQLALISGINVERVHLFVFFVGSILAGTAGIVFSLDVGLHPTMGMNPLMMAVVIVIIGGINNIIGTIIAGFLFAITCNLGGLWLGSEWKDVVAFSIFIAFLLFRPQGLFGKKLRKTSV